MVEEKTDKRETQTPAEVVESETGAKRPIEEEAGETKKAKKHRRRRNYEELDQEIAKEDKSKQTGSAEKGGDSESEVDDEKLDQLMTKEDEEEDDLSEIDASNIITTGRRTRGKIIDYKKTAEELEKNGQGKNEDKEEDEELSLIHI